MGIMIGAAFGACSRYFISKSITDKWGKSIYGTLLVNTVGSFLLGMLYIGLTEKFVTIEIYKVAGVAFLGSFTTFSTFAVEGVSMIKKVGLFKGLVYCYIHTIICLLFCFLGILLMKLILL